MPVAPLSYFREIVFRHGVAFLFDARDLYEDGLLVDTRGTGEFYRLVAFRGLRYTQSRRPVRGGNRGYAA